MKGPIEVRAAGIYCPEGEFYIDAWKPVPLCLVTHAHSDHARMGHKHYIATDASKPILNYRLGDEIKLHTYPYGEKFKLKNSWVSFHPAGHILGSAQIRIETPNNVCVISGDYKRAPDPTCEPFEVIPCDTFVTESTFALPIYNWEPSDLTIKKIYEWWQSNRKQGFNSVLYCYALGKAQRIMAMLKFLTDEPIYLHGGIIPIAQIYKIPFLPVEEKFTGQLVLAPPSAQGSPWNKRFYPYKTAYASGWMQVRGTRKRSNVDRGFVLSDHADWTELISTVKETGAEKILTTHGNSLTLARYLKECGIIASPLRGAEIIEEGEV